MGGGGSDALRARLELQLFRDGFVQLFFVGEYAAWEIHPVMKIAVNGPSLLCRISPVAFFMKPFDDEKFIAAVRDALNQSLSRK